MTSRLIKTYCQCIIHTLLHSLTIRVSLIHHSKCTVLSKGVTISGVTMQGYNKIPILIGEILAICSAITHTLPSYPHQKPIHSFILSLTRTQQKTLLPSFHSSNKQSDLLKIRLCLLRLLSGSSSGGSSSSSLLSLGLGLGLRLLRLHRTTPLTSLSFTYDCFRISRISASSTFFSEGYAAKSMVSPLMRLVPLRVSSTVNL